MSVPGYRDTPPVDWDSNAPVDLDEAEDFLRLYYTENSQLGSVESRLGSVRRAVAATGTYRQTYAELVYGARVAWRNASRCIGRLYWRSLVVRDLRTVRGADAIFAELVRHLELAGQRERSLIRPIISIFAPAMPGRPATGGRPAVPGSPGARVWNEQLIRYAGHRQPDGSIVGDPRYVDFTDAMRRLGWRGKEDPFNALPLVIESPGEPIRLYDLPESAIWEVPLTHPEYRWFAELGLRWHAVPAISNMRLSIGGINYPLAPFNGWYMGTEIGARNLADPDRYDLLPVVAQRMGLDTSTDRTLWRDRALVELNRAVLWSFDQAGVRISDHHSESQRFLAHVASEERAGRQTPADWTWIVPPLSGGATAVFHQYYHEADQRPNFYLDDRAQRLATFGRLSVRRTDRPGGHRVGEPRSGEHRPGEHRAGEKGGHGPFTGSGRPRRSWTRTPD